MPSAHRIAPPRYARTPSASNRNGIIVACLAMVAACHDNPYEPVDAARPRDIHVAANVTVPPSLPSRCGFQLTGVAFDGTYYYVAEGQFGGNCLIRYTSDGQYVDQTNVNLDMRGLHWSPALGKLTTRHYNGGIVAIDYPAGTYTVLANYRTGPDQYAPAVDTDGTSYWIINGANAERRRLSDNALLKTIAIAQDNPFVIGVSNRWIYTVLGGSVNIYSKATGYQVATQALNGALGCQGWGFGASANGDRLLYVANCASATGQATNMGAAGLTSSCGRQLTGVAFDGNNYFVAEGQFSLNNCISRFTADSQFIDQIVVPIDMRGLHWVPALGKLTTRHYNGGIFAVDYATGSHTVIANYRTGPDQFQPAVDPDGQSYWIINGANAEQHRLSDDAVLRTFAITTDDPFVIGVSDGLVFTHDATSIHAYDKGSGLEVATLPNTIVLGCQGWGFGASSSADRLLYVRTCGEGAAQAIMAPITVTVNPGAFTGNWQVLGGVIGSGTGTRSFTVPPGDYTMHVGSVAQFVFHVLADGSVTVDNAVAASGGLRSLTFNTIAVAIDPGVFPLPYLVQGFSSYAAGARTLAMLPGLTHHLDVGAALGSSTMQFTIAANGDVTSLNPASATGGAAALTLANVPIAIDPVAYGGQWRFLLEPAPSAGARTVALIPGMTFGLEFGLGLAVSTLYFDVGSTAIVTPGNLDAAIGGQGTLTFRNSTIHVSPSVPSAPWGIHLVTASSGIADVVLVPGLSFALTAPGAPGVFSHFALSEPCGLTPPQHVLAAVTYTLACGPFVPPNTAPVVGTVVVPGTSQLVGTLVGVSVAFTDAEPGDTHTATIDWGDGTSSAGTVTESGGSGTVSGSHAYSAPGTYSVAIAVTDNRNASGSATPGSVAVHAVTPVSVWLGVKSAGDVGAVFDLRVEIERDGVPLTSGEMLSVPGGGNGFGRAVLRTINTTLTSSPTYAAGNRLGVRVLVRMAASSPKSRATARLWYGDASAQSRAQTYANDVLQTFYFQSAFGLATTVGAGPRVSADVLVDRNVGGNPYRPFGVWSIVF